MEVGDVVVPSNKQQPLQSGCSLYSHAIVVQVDPFVLVSEESDMRWESTVEKEQFVPVGVAKPDILERCMRRL
jgi:hypothetical protein